ncbi:hypothetical protein MASR2M44_00080 [Bacteroidota bacterium]
MNREDLMLELNGKFPSLSPDDNPRNPGVFVDSTEFLPFLTYLRKEANPPYDFLFCLTCVDWKDHLLMVYHLRSKANRDELVVKVKLSNRENPEIESLSGLWRTAEFHEREVFDLFGVKFLNHPDLRRLFLDENWEGFPLRKDYQDENMIEL